MRLPVIFRVLLPLVIGILSAYFTPLTTNYWFVFTLSIVLLGVFIVFRNQSEFHTYFFGVIATLFFFLTGVYIEGQHDQRKSKYYFADLAHEDSLSYFKIEISSYPEITTKWIKTEATVMTVNEQPSIGKTLIYIESDSSSQNLEYGDQIYMTANFFPIKQPLNPNEFDYSKYQAHHTIYHQAFIPSGLWIKSGNNANAILEAIYKTRKKCSEIIENSTLTKENQAVAKALLIGDKEYISDELMLSYAASGTLHVLAVSGLHVGIVMLILNFLLQPVKRIKYGKVIFLILALCGIWFYTLLTGFSPSILRAAVMFSFVLVGNQMQRDTSIYQSLLVSALILILIDPHVIFQIGFLLSYLAVFGIVFFYPKIYPLFYFKNKIVDKIWQVSSVSIAAQIATFPLAIYCFHQFPNYFILANLLVIPVSFLILVLGIFALIFYFFTPVSDLIFYGIDLLISFMNDGVKFVETLPFAITEGLSITWYDTLLLFSLIFSITFSLTKKSKNFLTLSLGIFTAIIISSSYQRISKSSLNELVFYSVKNEILVDVFSNSEISSVSTPAILSDTLSMKFHVYPNRMFNTGKTYSSEQKIIDSANNLFLIGKKKIAFVNQSFLDSVFTNKIPLVDCIYLYNSDFIRSEFVNSLVENRVKVISGFGNSYKLRRYLSDQLKPDSFYDIPSRGALIVDL